MQTYCTSSRNDVQHASIASALRHAASVQRAALMLRCGCIPTAHNNSERAGSPVDNTYRAAKLLLKKKVNAAVQCDSIVVRIKQRLHFEVCTSPMQLHSARSESCCWDIIFSILLEHALWLVKIAHAGKLSVHVVLSILQ